MPIHPTAVIDSSAKVPASCSVGAYCVIGANVELGESCELMSHVVVQGPTRIGSNNRFFPFAAIGIEPQDITYKGEPTRLEIGDHNVIREYVTINRGTTQSYRTTVGRNCLIMSYVHLGHDCHLGDHVIVSNSSQFAGHVTVEDRVGISGLCAFHQFVRVGRNAYVGGCSRVAKDVPPFVKAVGNPVKLYGLNSVGLQRSGFAEETIAELKRAYRLLFRSDLNLSQAVERGRAELNLDVPEVLQLLEFVESSGRGVGF